MAKATLASSQGKQKKIGNMARLEEIPAHGFLIHASDFQEFFFSKISDKKKMKLDKKYILVKQLSVIR